MHTPGPWTAMVTDTMGDEPALWEIVQRSSGGTVAEIQSHNVADAALMAAAPDMLEALRAMVDYFGQHPDVDNGLDETLTAARAAIARATGNA